MQISLKLHQPNMHIRYRVIPKVSTIVSLARLHFIWNLTHSVANYYLLQKLRMKSKEYVWGLESAPTCFRLWRVMKMEAH